MICLVQGITLMPGVAMAATTDSARIAALEVEVHGLLDREAIRGLVTEYGRSVDDRDWKAQRAIYTDPLEVDYSSMPGAPGPAKIPLDAWMKQIEGFFGRVPATQHITQTLALEIDGDHAHAETMLHAQHYMPNSLGEPVQRMIGTYDLDFVRTPQGWRICRVKPNLRWNEGNYWIFLKASGKQ